jgi:hypothetical protein
VKKWLAVPPLPVPSYPKAKSRSLEVVLSGARPRALQQDGPDV